MFKLIIGMLLVIVLFVGVDYLLTDATSQIGKITISNKFISNDLYCIKTISMEVLCTHKDIYDKLEIGNTYTVKLYLNQIKEIL